MRTAEQRTRDARAELEADLHVWAATADDHKHTDGAPPSRGWRTQEVVGASAARCGTGQNAEKRGQAQPALGPNRDLAIFRR
ncbi:MAG TPA: hypothetical protein VMV12_02700 [Candidatus Micrarchaeaceae archaeon]|nr:hypothetical protein [Candidatus Micrarchaeaceae archaeon]